MAKRPSQFGRRAQEQSLWIREVGRPAVIERDGETCVCCGATSNLTVDHIKTKGSRPDLKKDIANLQLLCFYCHRLKTDKLPCHETVN